MNEPTAKSTPNTLTDKPPVFRTWNQVYLFVLVFHLAIVVLFYWLTIAYA